MHLEARSQLWVSLLRRHPPHFFFTSFFLDQVFARDLDSLIRLGWLARKLQESVLTSEHWDYKFIYIIKFSQNTSMENQQVEGPAKDFDLISSVCSISLPDDGQSSHLRLISR